MRFRLRYLHHDLELIEGQFAVGRSAGCQLSLDDPQSTKIPFGVAMALTVVFYGIGRAIGNL